MGDILIAKQEDNMIGPKVGWKNRPKHYSAGKRFTHKEYIDSIKFIAFVCI